MARGYYEDLRIVNENLRSYFCTPNPRVQGIGLVRSSFHRDHLEDFRLK